MLDLRTRSRLGLVTGVVLALLLLTPLLGPGYVLIRDMAFVPRIPLSGSLLGRSGVPRGVPSELVVALLSRVIATGWLQDLVLIAIVVAGAWGAARLAPTTSRAGAVAAATTYGWSAYLHERLLLGQWALLVGWAVLPWGIRAALKWRRGASGWSTVGCLAVAAAAGANALLLVAVAVVICGRPLRALAATAVLSLPWVVPGLLVHLLAGDPAGVGAFAARDDSWGVLVSLLTGGGVWAQEAAPPGRSTGTAIAVVVLAVAAAGLPRLRRRTGNALLLVGALGLLLSLLGRLPVTAAALRWAVVHVPATGLLRDGQRWIALLTVATAAAVACGVEAVAARVHDDRTRRVAAALLALAPLAALPAAAWGEGGRLAVSSYPREWTATTRQAHGAVLVLPWTQYRAFPWAHRQPVLDPAVKLLSRAVVNDALPLNDRQVKGEDPLAARLDATVRSGVPLLGALRREGVSEVLVERTTQGFDPVLAAAQTAGLDLLADTPELRLYAVPNPGPAPRPAPLWPVLLGDVVALALALTAAAKVTVRSARARTAAAARNARP